MKKENILLMFLAAIVLAVFFFPNLGWDIRSLLAPRQAQNQDYKNLLAENELLKTELAKSDMMKNDSSRSTNGMTQAFVYSSYPFNFKNRILVNAGNDKSVKIGQPVFAPYASSSPVLIGKVTEVFGSDALVETVFDSDFQLSVKVGSTGVTSLLKGGNSPMLTLMPKDAKVNKGDAVYSAGQDYPFGLPVGSVGSISVSSDKFFEEADLETPYNPNDLQTVFIDTNYNVKSIQ